MPINSMENRAIEELKKCSTNFNENEFKEFESKIASVLKIIDNTSYNEKNETKAETLVKDETFLDVADKETFIGEVSNRKIIKYKSLSEKPQQMDKSDFMKEVEEVANKRAAETLVKDGTFLDAADEETFIVKVRDNRTIINHKSLSEKPQQMDKSNFMNEVEEDANKRAAAKIEKEKIVASFRKLGNEAFRNGEYEKATTMYTKAIYQIKNSPILYTNRALSYIKLKLNKRAISDCDFVIDKLDEKNLRGHLYRATAYYKLNDDKNFESSVKLAKEKNPKEIPYIEDYLKKLTLGEI